MRPKTAEDQRLIENKLRTKNWQRWGTYLPERQWGTVQEDYSYNGDVWNSFCMRWGSSAYRWGEDGLLGWKTVGPYASAPFSEWAGLHSEGAALRAREPRRQSR